MNKDQLRKRAQELAAEVLTPFQWPGVGTVFVKSLTEPELLRVSKNSSEDKGDFSSFLIAATVRDEDGNALFSATDPDDYALLIEMPAVHKRKLVEFAAKQNGLGSDAVETALGNSRKPESDAGALPSLLATEALG